MRDSKSNPPRRGSFMTSDGPPGGCQVVNPAQPGFMVAVQPGRVANETKITVLAPAAAERLKQLAAERQQLESRAIELKEHIEKVKAR